MAYFRSYKGGGGVQVVTWADGTDEEIAAMLNAHYAGKIDIHDYWTIGDTRKVSLSAIPATDYTQAHAAQTVDFVLTESGKMMLEDNTTECAFQVDLIPRLAEQEKSFKMTEYGRLRLKTWLDDGFRNAIPSSLVGIFKKFKCPTADYINSATTLTYYDVYFALRAGKEVALSYSNYCLDGDVGTAIKANTYYYANSILVPGSLRSVSKSAPGSKTVQKNSSGNNLQESYTQWGYVAPFGCI